MKYALKKWWLYLIGFAGYIASTLICLFPRIMIAIKGSYIYDWPKTWVTYSYVLVGVVLVLVGFIIQDFYRAHARNIINDWDNDLPDEYLNKAWMIFLPFIVSGGLSFLTGLVFLFPPFQF